MFTEDLSKFVEQKEIIFAHFFCTNYIRILLFSSPDPKGHVSYCHHLASVVRRKLFQKSSPLKVLDQWKPNLV